MTFSFIETLKPSWIRRNIERLETNWTANGDCHEWSGPKNHCGYGVIGRVLVHRAAFALFKRDFPRNQFICHHCDNPSCYNIEHLYIGDYKTNARDAKLRGRNRHGSGKRKITIKVEGEI